MALFRDIQRETGVGIILITHDLGVAASLCHRIAVMYAGRIVETGRYAPSTAGRHTPIRARCWTASRIWASAAPALLPSAASRPA